MKLKITIPALLFCCVFAVSAETPLFEKPREFRQHTLLLHRMVQAMRSGDIEKMEQVCRRAVEIMPGDATWTYNLACALAYKTDKSEALDTLEKAVDLGFRNPDAIRNDNDLKQLENEPRFAEIIDKAEKLRGEPVPGAARIKPVSVLAGLPFEINPSNTVWDMDQGCFKSMFRIIRPSMRKKADANTYKGPASDLIRTWMKEGSASGNSGDLYMNRDRGHSKAGVEDFPKLTPVVYCKEAKEAGADRNLPNTLFEYPLVGNSSMAMTQGPFWRSLPRAALCDQFSAVQQCRLYMSNQLWVYPGHKDFDPGKGDLFPVNAPFFTVVRGSSFKDKTFVRGYLAALAALPSDTKKVLISSDLIGPTVQMMMRYTSNRITKPSDYLSGAAHPVVFEPSDMNVTDLVKMAHSLRPDEVVPPVRLQVIRENKSVPGIDYFDQRPEVLFNTPVCTGRIARGKAYRKTMTIQARSLPRGSQEYRWVLLQGDPSKVEIKKLSENGDRVEISVAWHGFYRPRGRDGLPESLMSSRVDIGCFVKGSKYYSAPSIVSVYNIASEERVYDEEKIVSIDYNNPDKRYMDPALSVHKPWKDLYSYTDDGKLKGWYRRLGDRTERYTWAGHRVLESDRINRPVRACAVTYLPRSSGDSASLPLMTCVSSDKEFVYTYKGDEDFVGSFASAD
ncbi:MAG: hypothetical protein R6V06_06165 [Kiritimatiellia bacterium]